jgi:transcription initiation factor TFIIB
MNAEPKTIILKKHKKQNIKLYESSVTNKISISEQVGIDLNNNTSSYACNFISEIIPEKNIFPKNRTFKQESLKSVSKKNKKNISPMDKIKIWNMFEVDTPSSTPSSTDNIPIIENTVSHSNDEVGFILCDKEPEKDVLTHIGSLTQIDNVSKTSNNLFQNIDQNINKNTSKVVNKSDDKIYDNPAIENTILPNIKEELYKTHHLCEKCDSVLLMMEDSSSICVNPHCGIIYKDIIDYSPEWRFYGTGDNKNGTDTSRCGNPINPLLIESSFGCKILCNGKSSFEMKRIRKWTEWTSTPHREKSLYEEFQFITTMAHNSGIPKIFIDYAMIIHKDISEQKMFRGMNRDGIKAASIYISCKLNGCPRTAHEIAEIFKLDKQSTTLGCSNAIKILNNVERNVEHSNKSEFKTTTASSFIERYCCKLGISQELTLLAKFIAIKTEQTELLCNNTPQSCAAGIIQFISQTFHLGISKINIKSICGVSEVTIGKCCKKMESIKEQLVPQCILQKYGIEKLGQM